MKSPHAFYYTAMTLIAGLCAIAAGATSLVFAALGERNNCLLALGLLVTLSLLSLIYHQLSKPKSWSTGQTRGIYRIR
jgi:hypothetical protein